ncbi:MAG: peptidylprolyl isomerase [Deltaproteobacteria bacterium]|nr:peptidylprolyl isomerase [Candidatus Anaeroferrophillus wilburensis]MBN2890131.1 peptidylprolyl isomerase [Deltaproteobacteria bacterium]
MAPRKKLLLWIFPALILLGTGLPAAVVRAQVVDRLLVVVGDQVITSHDLQQAVNLEFGKQQFATFPSGKQQEEQKRHLQKLVDELLLAYKAKKSGIEVSDEELQHTIDRVMQQNNMDLAALKQALQLQGMTFENYRLKLAKDLLQTKFINQEIKSHIILPEQEIYRYAKENNLLPTVKDYVTLAQILLLEEDSPAGKAQLERKITEIRSRLAAGESFFALAEEFSVGPAAKKGGRLGTFNKGSLLPEIEAVAFGKLPLNEMSHTIKTDYGSHLIMVLQRSNGQEEAGGLDPELENKIKNILFGKKVQAELEEMLVKLRQEVPISYKN